MTAFTEYKDVIQGIGAAECSRHDVVLGRQNFAATPAFADAAATIPGRNSRRLGKFLPQHPASNRWTWRVIIDHESLQAASARMTAERMVVWSRPIRRPIKHNECPRRQAAR